MATIKDIFKKRKEYDSANPNFEQPQLPSLYTKYYIDTWNVSPFYGKVDTLGIPVIPKQSLLRYCTYGTDDTQLLALQPVINFFFPLRKQYESYYNAGSINKNGKFFNKDLLPKKAYINSNAEYQELIKDIYRNFVNFLLQNKKFNSITTYDEFLNELLIYTKTSNSYFTRGGYVESSDYSLLHTGLSIDIYDGQVSNEEERLGFYNDRNSDAFLELCIRNNLKIDREIPWRVFLDIRTKSNDKNELTFASVIKEYIPGFEKNLQLFFDTYYDRVVPYDTSSYAYFEEFISLLQSFYFSFINSYPFYKKYAINNCGSADVKKLQRAGLQDSINYYDRKKYLDLYLKFRNIELGKVVQEEKLMHYSSAAIEIFKSKSILSTAEESIISAIKYYTNNIGTLAYRSDSLYEIDQKDKMV